MKSGSIFSMRNLILRKSFALIMLLTVVGCGKLGYHVEGNEVFLGIWDGSRDVQNKLEGAEADSFKILLSRYFAADKKTVYRRHIPIPGADAMTFRVINRWHAVDKNHGYHDGYLIPNSRGEFFESLDSTFSKDDRDAYLAVSSIGACHAPTYRLLVNFWAKDKECAYSGFDKIDGAHIDSFEGLNRLYAKDKNRVYTALFRKPEAEEISNLSEAQRDRIKESYNGSLSWVYVIENADAETFEPLSEIPIYGRDKNRCYKYDKPFACADIE